MLILGSKSPRRKEILEMCQIPFKVVTLDVQEDIENDDPVEYVKLTALKKAEPLLEYYSSDTILCCDTIVYIDNKILGKPKSRDDAYQMIKEIQGRYHIVVTGVVLGNKNCIENWAVETKVYVSPMSEDEIEEYINTNEPYDKAGAYAIQGIFGKYIQMIEGDYYNVMGLPINEVYQKLKRMSF